jgi:TetR/AcrR family transcriptional regulator, regulator of cefoperazone and chloramphenicol sensitivity
VKAARGRTRKDEEPVQKRIIEAAIACIERDGPQGATIREIAREAGVNSAAISYYFRSKDALMTEALAATLENAFGDWEVLLKERSKDLDLRVRSILLELIAGALKFPGLVKTHLYDTFMNGASRTAFIKRFAKFLTALTREMAVFFPDRSVREIRSEAVQMVSAAFLPGLMPQLFRNTAGLDLSEPGCRVSYVDSLVTHFLG